MAWSDAYSTIDAIVAESEEDLAQMPWRRLHFDGLERVLWRPGQITATQRLWCNGLLIENTHETVWQRRYASEGAWHFETADVMVFDGRGLLPLALTRDRMLGQAPYHEALRRDFLLDHCAWLLARASVASISAVPKAPMWEYSDAMSPGDGWMSAPPYMDVEGGLLPWARSNIAASGIDMIIAFDGKTAAVARPPLRDRALAHVPMTIYGGFGSESHASVATRHMSDFTHAIVPAKSVLTLTRSESEGFSVVGNTDSFVWRTNEKSVDEAVAAPLVPVASALARQHDAMIVTFATVDRSAVPKPDALTRIWTELELPAVIPRNQAEREHSCGKALATIGDRVSRHLNFMSLRERTS